MAESRTARLREYCQTARQLSVDLAGSQTGSARLLRGWQVFLLGVRGVIVSMICPSSKAVPFQWKWGSSDLWWG